MAEYIANKEQEVELGEPITFSNKCKSVFSVGTGIVFYEDGKYLVMVKGNCITVQDYNIVEDDNG